MKKKDLISMGMLMIFGAPFSIFIAFLLKRRAGEEINKPAVFSIAFIMVLIGVLILILIEKYYKEYQIKKIIEEQPNLEKTELIKEDDKFLEQLLNEIYFQKFMKETKEKRKQEEEAKEKLKKYLKID